MTTRPQDSADSQVVEPSLPRTKGAVPPVYLLLALLSEWGLHAWLPVAQWLSWPWRWAGAFFIAKGLALAIMAVLQMRKHQTTVEPFHRSEALVTSGPFAWNRNPIYTGMLLVLSGEALLFGSVTPWLMVPVMWFVLHRLFVAREEEGMRMQFGAAYDEYCSRVKRWI